ncbi:MAG: hypothetical protein AB7V18_19405 [Pyrinomonadaceae bacterium]
MKKKIWPMAVVLALAAVSLGGCAGSDKTFAASADLFVNKTVGPEYEAYVMADPNLDAAQKEDRIRNVESFRNVVRQKVEGR